MISFHAVTTVDTKTSASMLPRGTQLQPSKHVRPTRPRTPRKHATVDNRGYASSATPHPQQNVILPARAIKEVPGTWERAALAWLRDVLAWVRAPTALCMCSKASPSALILRASVNAWTSAAPGSDTLVPKTTGCCDVALLAKFSKAPRVNYAGQKQKQNKSKQGKWGRLSIHTQKNTHVPCELFTIPTLFE